MTDCACTENVICAECAKALNNFSLPRQEDDPPSGDVPYLPYDTRSLIHILDEA